MLPGEAAGLRKGQVHECPARPGDHRHDGVEHRAAGGVAVEAPAQEVPQHPAALRQAEPGRVAHRAGQGVALPRRAAAQERSHVAHAQQAQPGHDRVGRAVGELPDGATVERRAGLLRHDDATGTVEPPQRGIHGRARVGLVLAQGQPRLRPRGGGVGQAVGEVGGALGLDVVVAGGRRQVQHPLLAAPAFLAGDNGQPGRHAPAPGRHVVLPAAPHHRPAAAHQPAGTRLRFRGGQVGAGGGVDAVHRALGAAVQHVVQHPAVTTGHRTQDGQVRLVVDEPVGTPRRLPEVDDRGVGGISVVGGQERGARHPFVGLAVEQAPAECRLRRQEVEALDTGQGGIGCGIGCGHGVRLRLNAHGP